MQLDYSIVKRNAVADFMIVTTTRVEHDSILELLKPVCRDGIISIDYQNRQYHLGKIGLYNVVLCKCKEPGSSGPGGSAVTVTTALSDWPLVKGVFMTGICFGMNKNGDNPQKISDVIASEKVYPYEKQTIGKEKDFVVDKKLFLKSDENLLGAFEESNRNWDRPNLEGEITSATKGVFVSGEKAFIDIVPIEELHKNTSFAKAGDMEGHGLASACHAKQVPWLLMKGISDFGDRPEDNDDNQHDAAKASAAALLNILNNKESKHLLKISPDGSVNFFFHGIKNIFNDVFFYQYRTEVEQYYLERKIDKQIEMLLKTGNFWLYGQSGVGKSVLITRALSKIDAKPLLCDLSRLVGRPVDQIFYYIYEKICMLTKETIDTSLKSFEQISLAIFGVVRKHYANKTLFIRLEEIPIDFNTPQFQIFVEKLYSLMISGDLHLANSRIAIIVSTIESPIPMINKWQAKISTRVKFKEMPQWEMDDCKDLIKMLSDITMLSWDENYNIETFINDMKFNPSRIKKCLSDIVSMELHSVSQEIVEFINN